MIGNNSNSHQSHNETSTFSSLRSSVFQTPPVGRDLSFSPAAVASFSIHKRGTLPRLRSRFDLLPPPLLNKCEKCVARYAVWKLYISEWFPANHTSFTRLIALCPVVAGRTFKFLLLSLCPWTPLATQLTPGRVVFCPFRT